MKVVNVFTLLEARKNPDKNPKQSINQALIAFEKQTTEFAAGGVLNGFVSLTEIDKLGINPTSPYDSTPLGIYAYPIEYAVGQVGLDKNLYYSDEGEGLPFAGELPYANLFNATGNIINVATMTDAEANKLYIALSKWYTTHSTFDQREAIDRLKQHIEDAKENAYRREAAGGRFWFVTFEAACDIVKQTNQSRPIVWNQLFRGIGVDGVIDYDPKNKTGLEIIHFEQPTQAVFFSIKSITNVKRILNKYSPNDVKTRISQGKKHKPKHTQFRSLSYEEQRAAIIADPTNIQYAKRHDVALQLLAIEQDPNVFFYHIQWPTYDAFVKVLSLSNNDNSLVYRLKQNSKLSHMMLKTEGNPNLQLKAAVHYFDTHVVTGANSFNYMSNETIKELLKRYPASIQHFGRPSKDFQLIAINSDYRVYSYIKNPCTEATELYNKLKNKG